MSDTAADQPPGQRRVVVLREGPPKARGRRLDGILGILGGILLILAVVLVMALPETTVPDPQYRVEYGDELVEITSSRRSEELPGASTDGAIPAGRESALESLYGVEFNNVFEVTVGVFFEDNRPESLPDVIRWELFYPNGTSAGISSAYETLPTRETELTPGVGSGSFDTVRRDLYQATFNLGGKPEDRIVTFRDGRNGTVEDAEAAVVAQDTRATQGEWRLEIWLDSVGQCPSTPTSTSPDETAIRRAQICQATQQQQGPDVTNGFTLSKFEYRYYTIQVSEA